MTGIFSRAAALRRLRKFGGRGLVYVRRLRIWVQIVHEVSGVDLRSRLVLSLSALVALVSSLRDLGRWADPVLLRPVEARVRGVGRFHLRARSDDLYHVLRHREPEVFKAVSELLRPGDIFVDAGANIGFYSVLAARIVGPTGRVIGIEMMPETSRIFRAHVHLNGLDIEVVEKALSAAAGQHVGAAVEEGKSGQASIARSSGRQMVRVETTTLDEVLRGVPKVRLMKMDLEGAEPEAIKGATGCLERVEAIIFERLSVEDDITTQLEAAGYIVKTLDSRNRLATRPVS